MRIAKATREGRLGRAKALQWLLTHSFHAKLLAVRRVTSNQGAKTAGVDGEVWHTPERKMRAVHSLRRRSYRPLPLRRTYIPKKNGKLRPLGIPTKRDRAMQALHALALTPIAETTGDPNSYGFRPYRRCADAIVQCFNCLSKGYSPRWVLEGDIKACFDEISHDWLLRNIPMDGKILRSWLKAGYIDQRTLYPTHAGTPQGGIASPVLANMTLDGLEEAVRKVVPYRSKVHVIRYADDFVVTGPSKEMLEQKVVPAIQAFLRIRGLCLSEEKTVITRIEDGFDFLGQNLRKYGRRGKFLITPSKPAVRGLLDKVRDILRAHRGKKTFDMIRKLNPVIRGWANYHRHVCSSKTFGEVDWYLIQQLFRWARRRHSNKGRRWVKAKYFRSDRATNWRFYATWKDDLGRKRVLDLDRACDVMIRRHVKIRAVANPFDPAYTEYFRRRDSRTPPYL